MSPLGQAIHMGLIGFLILSGVLMAIAMIPLIILILLGWLAFNLTTAQKPRDVTRRTILGASSNGTSRPP